jgi:hypothetical protein
MRRFLLRLDTQIADLRDAFGIGGMEDWHRESDQSEQRQRRTD